MKRLSVVTVLAVLALVSVLLGGCFPINGFSAVVGSGHLETKNMDLTGFTAVNVGSAFQVSIKQGDSTSVSVTADDNVWPHVQVRKEGQTLRIYVDPGSYTRTTYRAEITMPTINALDLSGASQGTMQGFKSLESLKVNLSGASRLEGDAQATDVTIDVSGASRATLNGSANSLRITGSGASSLDMAGFTVDSANVGLSGASKADITAKNTLDYDLSGASSLTYASGVKIGRAQSSGASSTHSR